MITEDIRKANELINKKTYIYFDKYAKLYPITNECVKDYIHIFNKQNKVLSVIGSGDQILEMVNKDIYNIDVFDINHLTYYYLSLKIAAIKSLTRDEYISLFVKRDITSNSINLYLKIKPYLNLKNQLFWDYLINKNGLYKVFKGNLFYLFDPNNQSYLSYIEDNNFYNLKGKIEYVKLNYCFNNVEQFLLLNSNKYDLIYLSNIIEHQMSVNSQPEIVNKFLNKFDLEENGIIVNYLFMPPNNIREIYNPLVYGNYEFKNVNKDGRDSIMVYHKTKSIN